MSLKKNQSTPRPSEHPPVMGEKMSKRLGGIKGCKYKTFVMYEGTVVARCTMLGLEDCDMES